MNEADAFDDGYAAWQSHISRDANPWPFMTKAHEAWDNGWAAAEEYNEALFEINERLP